MWRRSICWTDKSILNRSARVFLFGILLAVTVTVCRAYEPFFDVSLMGIPENNSATNISIQNAGKISKKNQLIGWTSAILRPVKFAVPYY